MGIGSYTAWIIGSRFLQLAITLACQLFLARYFIPEEFGSFATLLATLSLWQMVFSLRLPLQILRSPAIDQNLYWNGALQESLFVTILLGISFFSLFGFSLDLTLLLIAHYVARIVDVGKAFHERLFHHTNVLRLDAGSHIAASAITVLFAFAGMGPWILALKELLPACLLLLTLSPRKERLRLLSFRDWQSLFRSAVFFWGDALFEQGLPRICILLAHALGGPHAAGIYFQAQRIVSLPHLSFFSLLSRYALHRFGRGDFSLLFPLYAWLTPPLALSALFLTWKGKEWIVFALGPLWAESSDLFQIMASALVFMTLFSLHRMALFAQHKEKALLTARLLQLTGVLLPPLLFPEWGLLAIGVGFSLGYALAFLSTCAALYRDSPSSFSSSHKDSSMRSKERDFSF